MQQKCFIEHLSGIIRVGPNCEKYGDEYELAVGYGSTDGKTVIIKGFRSDGVLKLSHVKAMIRELAKIGLVPDWERIRHANKIIEEDGSPYEGDCPSIEDESGILTDENP